MTEPTPTPPTWPPPDPSVEALYVHIPFCHKRCSYCDFPTGRYQAELADRYLSALAAERRSLPADFEARTLFVGGGTPTALDDGQLARLGRILGPFLAQAAESTIEANPNTIDADRASLLRQLGFNRVSLGAQSLQSESLEVLGRDHAPDTVRRAVAALRGAGFDSLNVDIIHGVPGQDLQSFAADLDEFLELGVEHHSLYCLIYEPGTPLQQSLLAKRIERVPAEVERQQYDHARSRLREAGFERYELANFARPGRQCRHNRVYWQAHGYYALGNGAAGYAAGIRYSHHRPIGRYLKAVESGEPPVAMQEQLSREERAREALVLGLRLAEGVDLDAFAHRLHWDPRTEIPETLERYQHLGMLEQTAGRLRLCDEALFVSDAVFVDLI